MYENARYAFTETCLALTVFRGDLTASTIALFVQLLLIKAFHWLSRVSKLGGKTSACRCTVLLKRVRWGYMGIITHFRESSNLWSHVSTRSTLFCLPSSSCETHWKGRYVEFCLSDQSRLNVFEVDAVASPLMLPWPRRNFSEATILFFLPFLTLKPRFDG